MHRTRAAAWRVFRLVVGSVALSFAGGIVGCGDRAVALSDAYPLPGVFPERLPGKEVDQVDLLFVIDNSRSMADKQDILAAAVPDLVTSLANPPCLDPTGARPPVVPGPTARCPAGFRRAHRPVIDIHLGVVSSSLGGHGSDACASDQGPSNVDMAHLLARKSPDSRANDIPTYQGKGFLAWDPLQRIDGHYGVSDRLDGEADLDVDSDADLNETALLPQLTEMVEGVGQVGCGFESQLESWYRFLVDPAPYATISVVDDKAVPQGIDDVLLEQRADFLRPGSLLAIILLSDENDCSLREDGFGFLAAQHSSKDGGRFHLWRPRSECSTDPNDPCCKSCKQPRGECPVDPSCGDEASPAVLSELEDPMNLRCFDQKRRFGFDFLYPIERYRDALTLSMIADRTGELVPNPIFTDETGASWGRDPGMVFFVGIVGVPWQDIARDPTDLSKGFKSSSELEIPVDGHESAWDILLGNPEYGILPGDPHMIESVSPRSGHNPITGAAIAPTDAPSGADEINGHERTIPSQDDLQYACIFDLPEASRRDCSGSSSASCDCDSAVNDDPLCEPGGGGRTLQARAKAYPGLRELEVLRALGSQGVVGSVCPKQTSDPTAPDYGYRLALGAVVDRLRPVIDARCLPRTLAPDGDGQVPCLIFEARDSLGKCTCDVPGREAVRPEHEAEAAQVLADPCERLDCVCELEQLSGAEGEACRSIVDDNAVQVDGVPVNGFCYIDASTVPPTGNPELVTQCPANERRTFRFVNGGEALPGAALFIACHGG